jgi:hypothetical protein
MLHVTHLLPAARVSVVRRRRYPLTNGIGDLQHKRNRDRNRKNGQQSGRAQSRDGGNQCDHKKAERGNDEPLRSPRPQNRQHDRQDRRDHKRLVTAQSIETDNDGGAKGHRRRCGETRRGGERACDVLTQEEEVVSQDKQFLRDGEGGNNVELPVREGSVICLDQGRAAVAPAMPARAGLRDRSRAPEKYRSAPIAASKPARVRRPKSARLQRSACSKRRLWRLPQAPPSATIRPLRA